MAIYTYDDGTGAKILIDNGAIAIDEACCCDDGNCDPCCQCWRITVKDATQVDPDVDEGCKEATGTLVDGDCTCSLDGTTVDICSYADDSIVGTLAFNLFRLTYDKIVVDAAYTPDGGTVQDYSVQDFDYDPTNCDSISFTLETGEDSGTQKYIVNMTACTGEACGCASVPESCPPGLTGEYRIAGYVDGDLVACAECLDDTNAPWDGIFGYISSCYWEIDVGGSYSSIDGKLLDLPGENYMQLNPGVAWEIKISCYSAVVWQGVKTSGDDPTGTYTRTGGCDVTPSIVIEAVP